MLQATRRTGEQGLLKLQLHQRGTATVSPFTRQLSSQARQNGLNGFIAPALLRAGARSRNISSQALSRRNNNGFYHSLGADEKAFIAMQQLRMQSTDAQRGDVRGTNAAAQQMPPDLAAGKREKDNTATTSSSSSSKTTSTQRDRDSVPSDSEKSASSKSQDAVTSEKATSSSSSSKEASSTAKSSSTSVAKPKEPLMTRVWAKVKHEASHYWSGTKLLGKEIKISARLQMKLLRGKSLTRREKRQVGLRQDGSEKYGLLILTISHLNTAQTYNTRPAPIDSLHSLRSHSIHGIPTTRRFEDLPQHAAINI